MTFHYNYILLGLQEQKRIHFKSFRISVNTSRLLFLFFRFLPSYQRSRCLSPPRSFMPLPLAYLQHRPSLPRRYCLSLVSGEQDKDN